MVEITKGDPAKRMDAVGELYFGAPIAYQYLATAPDSEIDVAYVTFEPGGRNKMHTHLYDQVIVVVEGMCIVADQNRENILVPGDAAVVPAGEPHWHGATADQGCAHLTIEKHNNKITIVG